MNPCIRIISVLLSLGMAGTAQAGNDPVDPWEGFNRKMFAFNEVVDRNVLKPAAEVYDDYVPGPVDHMISNFFSNLNDITVMLNNGAQGKWMDAGSDAVRISMNTTFGMFGLFDFATPFGFPKHEEDFGQTLGVWGMDSGPYLVLPIFGPRNVRDTGGLVVDTFTDPVTYVDDQGTQFAARFVSAVDFRAGLLAAEELIIGDKYVFMRDTYLQRRDYLINDGVIDDPFADGGF